MKNNLYKLSQNTYFKQSLYFIILVFFAWLIIFNFDFNKNFFQSDLFFLHLPTIKDKLGLPDVYNFYHMGGALHRPIYGYVPIEIFLSFFSQNELFVMTFTSVLICLLNGAFAMIATLNWSERKNNIMLGSFTFLIFCFLPISAWRITHGHLNFLMGINFFLLNAYFLSGLFKGKLTKCTYFIYFIICFNFFAQPPIAQIAFYNALFFFPIYLYCFFKSSFFRKDLYKLISITLLALAFNWDQLFLTIKLQPSDEFPRAMSPSIYSYMQATWSFISASIFSSAQSLNFFSIPSHLYHEVSYPLGLGVVFLAVFFLSKEKSKIKWWVNTFLIFSIYYLMGEWGAKEIFYNLPFFKMFRVPMRILIIINLVITLYVVNKLIFFSPEVPRKKILFLIFGFIFFSYIPLMAIEAIFLLMSLFAIFYNKNKYIYIFLLGIFTSLNIASFKEKIVFSEFDNQKYELITAAVEENNSKSKYFEKGMLFYNEANLNLNTALYFKVPSLEGYGFPLENFLKTYSSLTSTEYEPTRILFNNSPSDNFKTLNNLYNVKLFFNTNDYLSYTRSALPSSNRSVVSVKKFDDEVEQYKYIKKNYSETGYLEKVATSLNYKANNLKKCFFEKESMDKEISFELSEDSAFPCLIVLPFNFSHFLKVNSKEDIDLLPIDVSLLGVLIKKKPISSLVTISSHYDFSNYIFLKIFLWGALILLSGLLYLKKLFSFKDLKLS